MQNNFENSIRQDHVAVLAAIPVLSGAIKAVGSVVSAVGDFLGIGGKEPHDHQNNLAAQFNREGNSTGYQTYLKSWLDGVGKNNRGHVDNLANLLSKAKATKNISDIGEYNTYLLSFVTGIAAPLTPEMFTVYNPHGQFYYLDQQGNRVTDPNAKIVDASTYNPSTGTTGTTTQTAGISSKSGTIFLVVAAIIVVLMLTAKISKQ